MQQEILIQPISTYAPYRQSQYKSLAETRQYVDAIRTLAEAVVRRGRIFHQEMNLPVYNALKDLATAVQVGLQCTIVHLLA